MSDIKIIVATHKKYEMPEDSIYLPVHVGREGKEDLGYTGDNTGDNISLKNSTWCELTGLYWGWKNLDCDYIGLVQYRRHFMKKKKSSAMASVLNRQEAEKILESTDIILPKPRNYLIMSLAEHFNGYDFTIDSDLPNIRASIHEVDPSYDDAFDRVMRRKKGHMLNMFIMKKSLADQFCDWEYQVLSRYESKIDPNRGRLVGYAAEHMLDVWIERNGLKYTECDVVLMDKKNDIYRKIDFVCRKLGLKHRFIDLTGVNKKS